MKRTPVTIYCLGVALTTVSMNALAADTTVLSGHQTVAQKALTVPVPAPAPIKERPPKPEQPGVAATGSAKAARTFKLTCHLDNVVPVTGVRIVMQGAQGNTEVTIDRKLANNAVPLAKGHHRVIYQGPITANAKLMFYPAASGTYVVSNCSMKEISATRKAY